MEIQSIYQETIKFATARHLAQNQTIPGTDLPYVVHLSNVAMESHWNTAKKMEYRNEAIQLLEELTGGNSYLEERLQTQIAAYEKYIDPGV